VSETNAIRATSVPELLALIPGLLGFQPQESLVCVLVCGGRVAVTARAGLPEAMLPGGLKTILDRLWGRFPDALGCFIVYRRSGVEANTLLRSCAQLRGTAFAFGCHVAGEVWTTPEGRSGIVPEPPPAAAIAGHVGSRDELAARLEPDPPLAGRDALLDEQTAVLERLPPAARQARLEAILGLPTPTRGEHILAGLLVQEAAARGAAVTALTRRNAEAMADFWIAAARKLPGRLRPQALGLAALASWACGDGALQAVCLERARLDLGLSDEAFTAACLRRDEAVPALLRVNCLLNLQVVPPTAWDAVRAELLADEAAA
jgi:hypothetical protein